MTLLKKWFRHCEKPHNGGWNGFLDTVPAVIRMPRSDGWVGEIPTTSRSIIR